jgi:excisionase family DNA binding protein
MKVLTITEAAEVLPFSKWTLYRLAENGEAPFRKRAGKWIAIEDDLIEWVRTGERGERRSAPDPMPPTVAPKPSILDLVNQ